MLQCQWHSIHSSYWFTWVTVTQSTLQLQWMFQCQWLCQHCSYGCSSVNDTVNTAAAMDAPVSVTMSTLQLWMLQCQWHSQHCSCNGCSSVSDTVNTAAAMDAPVSVTQVSFATIDASIFGTQSNMQIWLLVVSDSQYCHNGCSSVNTLRPRQDRRYFADNIFMCILIKFSLKYVCKGPIDNNPALVQIMAWRRSGDKPLSEPMMISLSTHICITRPQWVNDTANSVAAIDVSDMDDVTPSTL